MFGKILQVLPVPAHLVVLEQYRVTDDGCVWAAGSQKAYRYEYEVRDDALLGLYQDDDGGTRVIPLVWNADEEGFDISEAWGCEIRSKEWLEIHTIEEAFADTH